MPVHFAAACSNQFSALARWRSQSALMQAANDNGGQRGRKAGIGTIGGEKLLRAALRHFAQHGLAAAERARENAEEAFFAGRSDEYRWWMAICATLDRRMPAAVAFHRGVSRS